MGFGDIAKKSAEAFVTFLQKNRNQIPFNPPNFLNSISWQGARNVYLSQEAKWAAYDIPKFLIAHAFPFSEKLLGDNLKAFFVGTSFLISFLKKFFQLCYVILYFIFVLFDSPYRLFFEAR